LRGYEAPRPTPPPAARPPAQEPFATTPAFLKSELPEPEDGEAHASLILSSDEIQRKLEAAAAQQKEQEWTPPPPTLVPERPKPKPGDVQGPIDWDSATGIFDAMVTGIRKDRQQHERDTIDQTTKLEADWQHVLQSMRELQRKVQGHRNLIYFTISRDSTEISIKVVDHSSKRGYSIFTLARKHPTGAHPGLNAIWMIEFPARERHFYDAKEAMAELVSRIAGSLA
jgi:hypothetical protein